MFDPVGSTSWHNRHKACFDRLRELLVERGPANPTVMIIGPGAVTVLVAPFLNDSAKPAFAVRKLIGDAARYSDQLLRRIPIVPLRSLEPVEVSRALGMPHQMIVVDRSRRALAAVARDLPAARCIIRDLVAESPGESADVVIAFNIVCRLTDPAAGMRNIVKCIKPDGLLLIDDRSARDHLPREVFAEVAPKTHRLVKIHRAPADPSDPPMP